MPFDFVHPLGLLFFLAIGPVVYLWATSRLPQGRARRAAGLGLRVASVAALALALAGMRLVRETDRETVIFAVDQSLSLDPAARRLAIELANELSRGGGGGDRGSASPHPDPLPGGEGEGARPDDRVGLVVFGTEAEIEVAPRAWTADGLSVREPAAVIGRDCTDIGRAIRLALAAFPEDARKHLIVISDGNENLGDAAEEADIAALGGLTIDAVALDTAPPGQEALVESVRVPPRVRADERFDVDVVIRARRAGKAVVRVSRSSASATVSLPPREVELRPGPNRLAPFPERLADDDRYVYTVTVEAPDDSNPGNNRLEAFAEVLGEARVLYAEGGPPAEARWLAAALEKAGFRVDRASADGVPPALEDLHRYDALILSDVAATRLSERQMEAIRAYVRDLGGGLIMAGGPESFGAGGYFRTPVEEALPVTMDLRHRRVMPSMAIVFAIDKSGSMTATTGGGGGAGAGAGAGGEAGGGVSKLELAVEGMVLTAELLQERDSIGVVGFDAAAQWVLPMRQKGADGSAIAELVRTMRPGGGTDIYPALVEAHGALRIVEAQVKHAIVLSDGVTNDAAFDELARSMVADKITISTVSVGDDADRRFMADLAFRGGGRHFHAGSVAEVPRIFTRDALLATRALVAESEDGFPLLRRRPSPILRGFDGVALPRVYGFVRTTPKERAEVVLATRAAVVSGAGTGPPAAAGPPAEDEPLLVTWHFGIGRSVAWAPDVKSGWGRDVVGWAGHDAFFAQMARFAARSADPRGAKVDLVLEGGKGKIVVEALDEAGEYRNFLDLVAKVAGPSGAAGAGGGREIVLRQVGPGRYQGELEATETGAYFATIVERGGGGSGTDSGTDTGTAGGAEATNRGTAVAVLAYPDEYRDLEPNPALLRRIAATTGGTFTPAGERPSGVFRRTGPPARQVSPLWFHLLAAAAALVVIEVAVRRLVLPAWVRALPARLRARREPRPAAPTEGALARLKKRKAAVRDGVAPTPAPAPAPVPVPVPVPELTPAPEPEIPATDLGYTARLLDAKKKARANEQ